MLPGKSSGDFTLLLSSFFKTEPKISHLINTLLNSSELHRTLPLSIIFANFVPVKLSITYLSSSTGCILSVNMKGKYPKNVYCFALSRVLYLCLPYKPAPKMNTLEPVAVFISKLYQYQCSVCSRKIFIGLALNFWSIPYL